VYAKIRETSLTKVKFTVRGKDYFKGRGSIQTRQKHQGSIQTIGCNPDSTTKEIEGRIDDEVSLLT
jgi:hypothetical protein